MGDLRRRLNHPFRLDDAQALTRVALGSRDFSSMYLSMGKKNPDISMPRRPLSNPRSRTVSGDDRDRVFGVLVGETLRTREPREGINIPLFEQARDDDRVPIQRND